MLGKSTSDRFRAPIFVVGAPRSGTTLLQAMLGAHPAISALPEMHFWLRIVSLGDYWGDVAEPDRFRQALTELVKLPGGLLDGAGFQAERILETVPWGGLEYRDLLDAAGRDLARRQGKARWSEKTPWQTADQIWELFPEAQVIHLIREPRDTVASILRAPFNDRPAWSLAEQWARYTVANIRTGTARGPEHYHQIRYEDLVRAPLPSLGLVCRFLGEEFESSMLLRREESSALFSTDSSGPVAWQAAAAGPVGVGRIGPGRAGLPAIDRARLGAAIRGCAGALGYEAPRRGTVLAGLALWPLSVPGRLARRRRQRGERSLSPTERFSTLQRYVEGRVATSLATSGDAPGLPEVGGAGQGEDQRHAGTALAGHHDLTL